MNHHIVSQIHQHVLPILSSNPSGALTFLNALKAQSPTEAMGSGCDYYRGLAFLHSNDPLSARQAFLEETRSINPSPWTEQCWPQIHRIEHAFRDFFRIPDEIASSEPHFTMAYHGVIRNTMLQWQRLLGLWRGVRKVAQQGGFTSPFSVIVECGVGGGGSAVLMAVAARLYCEEVGLGHMPHVCAFDTFCGMPTPRDDTRAVDGATAESVGWATGTCSGAQTALLSLARSFDMSEQNITPFPGDFAQNPLLFESLSQHTIGVAHIDCDWYDSTRVCLHSLYPRVQSNGYVQIDDYYYWEGCKRAVDEFIADPSLSQGIKLNATADKNAVWFDKP
eukprot:PhF_6_TR35049/c0_g1_i1/m.51071